MVQRYDGGIRPLVTYFAVTFAITWGGILAFLMTIGFDFESIGLEEGMVLFGFMLLGPSTAGLGLTARYGGRAALAGYGERVRRVRASGALWAVVLLANPLTLVVVLTTLAALVSPMYTPGFMAAGLAIGLVAGCIEELGWTGFATPRLLARYSPLRAGLMLGLLWASWHGLADYAGNIGSMTPAEWALRFVAYWLVPLTAYRVLMTWVYSRTASLSIGMLAHASYTGWQATLTASIISLDPADALVWQAAFAVALTLVVGVVLRWRSDAVVVPALRPAR